MTASRAVKKSEERLVPVLGQQIRVNVRHGIGVPLVLCNGIGASLEVLDPLVAQLDPDTTVVRFDVPGTGGSPDSPLPYGFPYLAAVLGRLLKKVGIHDTPVDVLGSVLGRSVGPAVRLPESPPLPAVDPRVDRHWPHHGARPACGTREDGHPSSLPQPRIRRLDRRRPRRRGGSHRSVGREPVVRPPADGRVPASGTSISCSQDRCGRASLRCL